MPKGRLEAFSDGVIAIVITLLVLEIHIPQLPSHASTNEVLAILVRLLPSCVAYLISFVICAVWWVAHHSLINDLREVDRPLLWMNNLFLLWLALLPFPTALLGQNPDQPLAAALYGVIGVLAGGSFWLMRWYASRHPALMKAEVSAEERKRRARTSLLSPGLYAAGFLISFLSPYLAILVYAGVAFLFAVLGLLSPRAKPAE